jgi:hypothetical protein
MFISVLLCSPVIKNKSIDYRLGVGVYENQVYAVRLNAG